MVRGGFQASIHEREPNDIFLKPDITFQQYSDQKYGGRLPVVRIADLAELMLAIAPDGAHVDSQTQKNRPSGSGRKQSLGC